MSKCILQKERGKKSKKNKKRRPAFIHPIHSFIHRRIGMLLLLAACIATADGWLSFKTRPPADDPRRPVPPHYSCSAPITAHCVYTQHTKRREDPRRVCLFSFSLSLSLILCLLFSAPQQLFLFSVYVYIYFFSLVLYFT